jgi:undecaprenyl-diphosphatase
VVGLIKGFFKGLFTWKMNSETRYVVNIIISMIPIAIIGFFFKEQVEAIFSSGLLLVGCMLLLTAFLLSFSYYYRPREKETISKSDALIIGISQATGLLLGNNKEQLAQFSFLMVIPPILGEALLSTITIVQGGDVLGGIPPVSLIAGFVAAFVAGAIACKWMINIVKRGKLIYFAIYCAVVGLATVLFSLLAP